jgi:hypothetical protein
VGEDQARDIEQRVARWLAALETRHRADLEFRELRHALQALSSLYVERRERIGSGAAFDGAGKRAAFALYYGPLHFFLVRDIVRAVGAADPPPASIVDLGCGTAAAGAAWAVEAGGRPFIEGVDRSAWAVTEARLTLHALGLRGRVRQGDAVGHRLPDGGPAIVAAFTVNELPADSRVRLLPALVTAAQRGSRVLVVEPLARRAIPWWSEWARAFADAGGAEAEWRFPTRLPEGIAFLGKAAGLDPREAGGRSLYLPGS